MTSTSSQGRRVELILEQLDQLPTLSSIAVQVLERTLADDSRADEVIQLISSDPSLASKVIRLSQCTDRIRSSTITTIERAVKHVGFEAVRSAVLSVEVFDLFENRFTIVNPDVERTNGSVFDREAFWQHSLAVAVLAESLAHIPELKREIHPSEAFLAGLLHDLGTLTLYALLPRSMDQVCRLAEANGISLNDASRRIIGITTQTVGKRLAERWNLPRILTDVIWLHGQPMTSLPNLSHRKMIGLITLADSVARTRFIVPAGHGPNINLTPWSPDELGVSEDVLDRAIASLPDKVGERARHLGLERRHDSDMLLHAINRANQSLGRINHALRQRAHSSARKSEILEAITQFHQGTGIAPTVCGTLERIARSAHHCFSGLCFGLLHQSGCNEAWQFWSCDDAGAINDIHSLGDNLTLSLPDQINEDEELAIHLLPVLSALERQLKEKQRHCPPRLMPVRTAAGIRTIVVLGSEALPTSERPLAEALSRSWSAALNAAEQQEETASLGEELADANRQLIDAQNSLTRAKAMAAIGEIIAGAAHEMNNPLAIISGRSQQLLRTVEDEQQQEVARQVVEQSHRLGEMISTLQSFVEPMEAKRRSTNMRELAMRITGQFKPTQRRNFNISTVFGDSLDAVHLDPSLVAMALTEVVRNAVEAKGSQHIELRIQTDPEHDRLRIQVRDDGPGLSNRALVHAFDPFFSEKAAGRQPGLGLSRARQAVEAHEGRITLENAPGGGAVVTLWINHCQLNGQTSRDAA
ncbi:MAG: HDOD domain-containing protein [Phycisphaerales bacterium]|nr:MAG: HDOD domain-containing protein [Phycisphaerales bacterium]